MGLKNFSVQLVGTDWIDVELDFDIDISTTPVLANNTSHDTTQQSHEKLHSALQRVVDHNVQVHDTSYYSVYGYVGDRLLDRQLDFSIQNYNILDYYSMSNLHIDMFIRYQYAVQAGLTDLARDCAGAIELIKRITDARLYNQSFDLQFSTDYRELSDAQRRSASYSLTPGDVLLSDITLGTRVGDSADYTIGNQQWGAEIVVTPQDTYTDQITLYTGEPTYQHEVESQTKHPPSALRKWGSTDFGYGYIRIGKFATGKPIQVIGEVTDYVIK